MLNPIRVFGEWDEGYVLDKHILKSVFLGEDENGRGKFETTRTEIGELIYRLKYKNDINCLKQMIQLMKEFLIKWNIKDKIDIVIPVPPSKKGRIYQPAFELAKEIAKFLNKDYKLNVLSKETNLQVKDGYSVSGTIKQNQKIYKKSNVLVIDDLYSTGKTLNEVCRVLRNDDNIEKIYCLAMTKTKEGRL